jgi:hypothetical protein
MKKLLTTAAVLVMLTTQATAAWWLEYSFTDADIDAMTKSITEQFEKREGVKVIEVQMLKENSKKAIGFVKLQVPLFGEITKSCSATMAENGRYIWQCQ